MMDFETSCPDSQYDSPKRKILGDLSNGSPVSPMANLRLLTKVATSPLHINPVSSDCIAVNQCKCSNYCDNYSASLNKRSFECGYIRRTKSLSVLCEKFLALFPLNIENEPKSISIKHIAIDLGVEKRRVYDIVNIIESLDMAKKFAKDSYLWYGNKNVPAKIGALNQYAYKIGLDKVVEEYFTNKNNIDEVLPFNLFSADERRIGVLCQKFIMLLLVCGKQVPVTLDMAATLLIDGNESSKTKSRRLYDISNMLITLGIITRLKADVASNPFKKPAFIYSGPCFKPECKCEKCATANNCQPDRLLSAAPCHTEVIDLTDERSSFRNSPLSAKLTPLSKEPLAKKRLTFNQEMNIIFKPISENVIHKQFDLKTCKPLRGIIIQRPSVKLEPGSLYKAVKVGSSMQLVKIP